MRRARARMVVPGVDTAPAYLPPHTACPTLQAATACAPHAPAMTFPTPASSTSATCRRSVPARQLVFCLRCLCQRLPACERTARAQRRLGPACCQAATGRCGGCDSSAGHAQLACKHALSKDSLRPPSDPACAACCCTGGERLAAATDVRALRHGAVRGRCVRQGDE